MKKRHPLYCVIPVLIISLLLCACSSSVQTPGNDASDPAVTTGVISNSAKPDETLPPDADEYLTPDDDAAKEEFATSTPENDTDLGLRGTKIDSAEATLTKEQKMIIQYFDEDYLEVEEYEFLSRYPKVFTGVQVRVFGEVEKVIALNEDTYQFVCTDYNDGYSMVVTCPISDTRFIEGDWLSIYGIYEGEKQIEVDGKTYIIPSIKAYSKTQLYEMGVVYDFNLYSLEYIKTIAEAIFGDAIEVRKPTVDDEGFHENTNSDAFNWYYVVELDNQSNAKFSKYLFSREGGYIQDMKSSENIQRSIEFSADFEHFFLFAYDSSLETLTLEYYDSNLNRLWKREFPETTNAQYDYTKNNIYLIANNELHIINIATGENTFAPTYVGERYDVRKTTDGILLLAENKSDAVMKLDLQGRMVWKTNLTADLMACSVQFEEDRIILGAQLDDDNWLHYIAIDNATGSVLNDAILLE